MLWPVEVLRVTVGLTVILKRDCLKYNCSDVTLSQTCNALKVPISFLTLRCHTHTAFKCLLLSCCCDTHVFVSKLVSNCWQNKSSLLHDPTWHRSYYIFSRKSTFLDAEIRIRKGRKLDSEVNKTDQMKFSVCWMENSAST